MSFTWIDTGLEAVYKYGIYYIGSLRELNILNIGDLASSRELIILNVGVIISFLKELIILNIRGIGSLVF